LKASVMVIGKAHPMRRQGSIPKEVYSRADLYECEYTRQTYF